MTANSKFERVLTDTYGMFKISDYLTDCKEDTGYVLIITDKFTRYSYLYFYEKVKSEMVIRSLYDWCKVLKTP